MTEQDIIESAMIVSVFVAPICTFFNAIVLHGILMLFGIYFTIWGAIFTYECAKWIFNLIFGG